MRIENLGLKNLGLNAITQKWEVKLDVGIGIGSDIDIRYRHPTLAVSGCLYRMLISKTDTDIQ